MTGDIPVLLLITKHFWRTLLVFLVYQGYEVRSVLDDRCFQWELQCRILARVLCYFQFSGTWELHGWQSFSGLLFGRNSTCNTNIRSFSSSLCIAPPSCTDSKNWWCDVLTKTEISAVSACLFPSPDIIQFFQHPRYELSQHRGKETWPDGKRHSNTQMHGFPIFNNQESVSVSSHRNFKLFG